MVSTHPIHHDESDEQLLARLDARDEAAFTALYDRYSSLVYGVAMRVLRDKGEAEDVLQEIFLQLWRMPQRVNLSRGSLPAWLAVIARNRCIDRLRGAKPSVELDDVEIALAATAERESIRGQLASRARKAMAGVPEEQRKLLELAVFEDLTHSQIAERTGTPLGTVKTRIRAALLALRSALA